MAKSKAMVSVMVVVIVLNATTLSWGGTECAKDTVKVGACGSWLGLVREVIGTPPSESCCSLVKGLADLEAASCFCYALRSNLLGVSKVHFPISLSLLLNSCHKNLPHGFVCS